MNQIAIGIDIGGTNTEIGFVTDSGKIIVSSKISTGKHTLPISFVKACITEIDRMKSSFPDTNITGIGIGAPNGNYYDGSISFAPNLPWKGVVKLTELFKKEINTPIFLTNDANAAAIGEKVYGAAKGMNDFIVITLGTGVGSGIVSNGKLVYGHDGFAGEIGHTISVINGRECGCGRKGCLETYASAKGICRTVFELMATENTDSKLRNIIPDKLQSKDIFDAAKNGDKLAISAFEITGKHLGMKLADSVAHTSPEAIILFGGLAQSGDFILKPIKKYLDKNLLNIYRNKIKVIPSKLNGSNAAVLGASALVWNELS